jgi:hypothetical protein
MTKFEIYICEATEALEAGFTSEAARKRARECVNSAFDILRDAARTRILGDAAARFPDAREDEDANRRRMEWVDANGYWDIPRSPHALRIKHLVFFADLADDATICHDLYSAIKVAEIIKVERDTLTEREAVVRESIADLLKRRGEQYNRALALGDIFGGLPVSANVHLVTNQLGTTFVRAFYYLEGSLTPLNVILAAAQELERRAEAA